MSVKRTLAAVALVSIVAAGCGDDDTALTADEFSKQGNVVCVETNEGIDAAFAGEGAQSQPGPEAFDALIAEVENAVVELRKLTPPKDLASDVDALLDDIDDVTAKVKADGPDALFSSEDDPFAKLDPEFSAVGLEECRSDSSSSGGGGESGAVEPGPDALPVTAVDFAFEGLPESVPAGVQFALSNSSAAELHELVALRIPDDETRSIEELTKLPEDELDVIFAGRPATVIIAPPGEDGFAVLGDGSIAEPGRYALICAIPLGADPREYLDAADSEGPPDVAGGPPHFTQGMFAELLVTGS